jgi:hypothetical protein
MAADDPDISELRSAYDDFRTHASPEDVKALDLVLAEAHRQATEILSDQRSQVDYPTFGSVWSMLHPELEAPQEQVGNRTLLGLPARVDGQGQIWGNQKYQQLDPLWAQALIQLAKFRSNKAPFRTSPAILEIKNDASFAIVGDWGSGFSDETQGAKAVGAEIRKWNPEYTMHIGDVYYAGDPQQEMANFVDLWHPGTVGSFTLNSNHEMYSGAHAYFEQALAATPFALQNGTSYFALFNENWLIVGLDTAYFSSPTRLYMEGVLDSGQQDFLAALRDPERHGKASEATKVIVLSHHEGLDFKGEQPRGLWNQVTGALGRPPDYWYWGHAHNAVAYRPYSGCLCRCVGHGAVPYGVATNLQIAPQVEWFETQSAGDKVVPERVLNGYLQLELHGPSLTEKFVGEDGTVRWP